MTKIPFFFFLFATFFFSAFSTAGQKLHSRHLLHQPFFPVVSVAPPPYQQPSTSQPPSPSPHTHHHHKKHLATPPPHEEHPFSSITYPPPPPPSPPHPNPFFPSSDPSSTATHPPPPPHPTTLPTFPANISSLLFPAHNNPSKPHHNRRIAKLVSIIASVVSAASLLSLFAVFIIFLRRTRHRRRSSPADDTKSTRSDSLQLFNAAPSDGSLKHKHQQQPPKYTSSNTSSEFLYLGTLVNSRSGGLDQQKSPLSASGANNGVLQLPAPASSSSSSSYSQYHKLGSPELRPLPPLPKLPAFTPTYQSTEQLNIKRQDFDGDDYENDEFYSPRGSSGRKQSPTRVSANITKDNDVDQIGRRSTNGSNSCSPTNSVSSLNCSPAASLNPHSPPLSLHSQTSLNDSLSKLPVPTRPPPPPPPPAQFWEIPAAMSLSPPRGDFGDENEKLKEKKEETLKPKLKPLHWDKVRASSSRVMVWDQIKSNSFQVNEEMIETLFRANNQSSRTSEATSAGVVQSTNQENRFLDPRKSHNIEILLRALNVTVDEVCEALVEGNSDTLGPELLECLLKMAPTKEEEDKLKDLKDDDETSSKIGPAEKFIKALLNIPFAFKRIDAMLYIVNFESEIEYLKRSFDTLEAACGELKNTRMFLKLLEAVLKTGNRMNIGTNRGDAHAFKLDTLLKLVDIKGADGKTTLLHFVVQEIIKSEGARVKSTPIQSPIGDSNAEQSTFQDDLELKKLGLQVVSSLSSQLINVKKAAAMDSTSLSNETSDIVSGITKVKEVITELKQETEVERFLDSMNMFVNKAEKEITEIQTHGSNVLKMVKEVTEYFHGNSEAEPFRIFSVVRDFLTILDQVCKEVGRVNERTVYGTVPRHSPSNQIAAPLFPVLNNDDSRLSHSGSLDGEDSF